MVFKSKGFVKYLLVLSSFFLLCLGCSKKEAVNLPNLNINFKAVADTIIAGKDLEKDSILVGSIRGISLNNDGDIYLLDNANKKVFQFDSIGKYKSAYISGVGRGPGEVANPNSIFVDKNNFVYLTDRDKRMFYIFEESGELFAEKKLDLIPSKITAFDTSKVFVTGFRFSFNDSNIVQSYSFENSEYSYVASFGNRAPVENELMANMSGFSDFISVAGQKFVLNRFFPYHFDIYDENLTLTHEELKEHVEFKPPARDNGLINLNAVGREILVLKDLVMVRYLVDGKSFFDIYDLNFEYLKTKSALELGMIEGGKHFASYPNKNQVISIYEDPYLNVMRYNFEKEKKEEN